MCEVLWVGFLIKKWIVEQNCFECFQKRFIDIKFNVMFTPKKFDDFAIFCFTLSFCFKPGNVKRLFKS